MKTVSQRVVKWDKRRVKSKKSKRQRKSPGTLAVEKYRPIMNKLFATEDEKETVGTRWAREIRAQCNKLTRARRDALLDRAMQLAYGSVRRPEGRKSA
jgi:hypothetical protein